ncbi:MAG: addiction module protein [Candidatus Dadabacteria bacterium]|nr:addiction module protein [Candidatus Dadabacteria bacterium]
MDSSLKNLPVDERIRLVEDLWDSIASDQNSISLSPPQKAKLDKRLEAYCAIKDPGHPADEVISGIRKKL